MHWEMEVWTCWNSELFKLMAGENFFHGSSEGSIDTIKIAQEPILNQNIDLKKRFVIACKYGLDENVKSLWSQMKKSDKKKCSKSPDNSTVGFWVRWLREGSPKPWSQAAEEYFNIAQREFRIPFNRFSALFPSLGLEDRNFFLESSFSYDYLSCLYAMTKEEQEEILKKRAIGVLNKYMGWPRHSLFMETADKLFRFLDADDFRTLLYRLSRLEFRGDFDYSELFREFWNRGPDSWKERTRKVRYLKMAISSWVDEINKKENAKDSNDSVKRKRKTDSDTGRKRIRKSRKL